MCLNKTHCTLIDFDFLNEFNLAGLRLYVIKQLIAIYSMQILTLTLAPTLL